MKGTKLWQAPGSPIIQGRSRTLRPFWEVWLVAVAWAEAGVIVPVLAWGLRTPGVSAVQVAEDVAGSTLIPSVLGCMLGAVLGIGISRLMGWRRPWIIGAVMGVLAGWAVVLLL